MTLSIFIPGNLKNPLNGSHRHWSVRARWAKTWREKTRLLIQPKADSAYAHHSMISSRTPKRVEFRAQLWNLMDEEGLRAALKPVVDGLRDAKVIHDDGPTSGHVFGYTQTIKRQDRGVEIAIALLEEAFR